jgi:hypothetical protein
MPMRLPGWELRLAELVDRFDRSTYSLGSNDCFRLACETVAALTGRDVWPQFEGKYATRADAIRLIRSVASDGEGADLKRAVEIVFGVEPVSILAAGRGDLYLFVQSLPHLGVGLGAQVGVMLPAGLGLVRIDDKRLQAAWRV